MISMINYIQDLTYYFSISTKTTSKQIKLCISDVNTVFINIDRPPWLIDRI